MGYDLTFGPPKAACLLFALGDGAVASEVRKEVEEAFRSAAGAGAL